MDTNRVIFKSINLPISKSDAWKLWTTEAGIESFMAPCRIDPKPGGPIEILFDNAQDPGFQGSEGCVFLAVQPEAMLTFTWNAPPSMPSIRRQRTFVQVRFFDPEPGKCEVSLHHSGWGTCENWTAAYNYFDKAWGYVFAALEKVANIK